MQVYKGYQRRQVGGNIWSTISRGVKPILFALLKRLAPHAKDLGKKVAKRAAKSALNIGSNLAGEAMLGKINKSSLKSAFVDEVQKLKTDAEDVFQGYKRKLIDEDEDDAEQVGQGAKRRKMVKSEYKSSKSKKSTKKGYKQRKGRKQKKRLNKKAKRRTKRKSNVDIDIFQK